MARFSLWIVALVVAGTCVHVTFLAGCSTVPEPSTSGPGPSASDPPSTASGMTSDAEVVDLPLPGRGELSVEEAIERRRSVREYQEGSVTLAEVAALAWACQGVTSPQGLRAAPSAGGTYPLTLYVVAGMVEGLEPGVYRYVPERHSLAIVRQGDLRAELAGTALDQEWVKEAPLNLVLAADYSRTTGVYGERGVRYVHIEVGHAAQNVYLQAVALGLGTVAVGAFDDEAVTRLLGLPSGEEALYIMPVGRDAG